MKKDNETLKILNLYAGIGGNRRLWDEVTDIEVTAIEYKESIAECYQKFFPDDEVIVTDAHSYLEEHFDEYDFIWSSPPCPSHSRLRKNFGNNKPIFPDMKLYEEILLLDGYFKGKWVIENVKSWYNPLIEPQKVGRHYYWSNFKIIKLDLNITEIDSIDRFNINKNSLKNHVKTFGINNKEFELIPNSSDYPIDKIIRNMVHPRFGKHILECALDKKVSPLSEWM